MVIPRLLVFLHRSWRFCWKLTNWHTRCWQSTCLWIRGSPCSLRPTMPSAHHTDESLCIYSGSSTTTFCPTSATTLLLIGKREGRRRRERERERERGLSRELEYSLLEVLLWWFNTSYPLLQKGGVWFSDYEREKEEEKTSHYTYCTWARAGVPKTYKIL